MTRRRTWTRLRRHVLSPTWLSFGVIVSALAWLGLRVLVLLLEPPGSEELWRWSILAVALAAGFGIVGRFGTEMLVRERAKRRPFVEMSRGEGMAIFMPTFMALLVVAIYLGTL